MKLKYEIIKYANSPVSYAIKCPNISCYVYWTVVLPYGIYKYEFFGLRFWGSSREIKNETSGIKINKQHEFEI